MSFEVAIILGLLFPPLIISSIVPFIEMAQIKALLVGVVTTFIWIIAAILIEFAKDNSASDAVVRMAEINYKLVVIFAMIVFAGIVIYLLADFFSIQFPKILKSGANKGDEIK